MRRCLISLLVFSGAISAQTKKVIANLPPGMVQELAATAPNVRIVPARGAELEREIVDADAMVGIPLTAELFKKSGSTPCSSPSSPSPFHWAFLRLR